jgi:hypothetical protein
MQVGQALSFDQYWNDPRFVDKRPNLATGKRHAFGDNIYHHVEGAWRQEPSHHAYPDGSCNFNNLNHDTQTDRMLVSDWFVYFGGEGPTVPASLRNFNGTDLYAGRGLKNNVFSPEMRTAVIEWVQSLGVSGYAGRPRDWSHSA